MCGPTSAWRHPERRYGHVDSVLTEGLVMTIEPMVTAGSSPVVQDRDGWTVRTRDGSLSAHYEHTILITRGAPVVLTGDLRH
jgi:methionine aminopeptidase